MSQSGMFDILPFGILPDAAVVHEPDLTPDDLTCGTPCASWWRAVEVEVLRVDGLVVAAWRLHFSLDCFVHGASARVGGGLRMPLQRAGRARSGAGEGDGTEKSSLVPASPVVDAPRRLRNPGVESQQKGD